MDGFKLWYSGSPGNKNGVGILVDGDLREQVVEVRRVNDWLLVIKLVVGGITLKVVSAYAPYISLDEEVKTRFWEELDAFLGDMSITKKVFICGDFNGHNGATPSGFDNVHGGSGFGVKNRGGNSFLNFARAFELAIANSCFPKKNDHLITFDSAVAKTQIDYLLMRKADRGLCKDCKVIPSENLTTQHKLLVMDLENKRGGKKKLYVWPREGGVDTLSHVIGDKLTTVGVWRSSGDAFGMWNKKASRIREAAREMLRVLKANFGEHQGDWWWNGEVQGRVEAKKVAHVKWVDCTDEAEK